MVGPSKHTYIHTHVHNEVTLVWGSLRLTPIICLRQLVPEGLNSATTDMIKKFLEHAGITNVHTGREHIWYCSRGHKRHRAARLPSKSHAPAPEAHFPGIGTRSAFLTTAAGKLNYFAFHSWKFRP